MGDEAINYIKYWVSNNKKMSQYLFTRGAW